MAIRTIITRGYGNGTFNGTIGLVVTRGYTIGAAVIPIEGLVFSDDVFRGAAFSNDAFQGGIFSGDTFQ